MCDTCGCGQPGAPVRITKPGEEESPHSHDHQHDHDTHHDHRHPHEHSHDHQHDHDTHHEHSHSHAHEVQDQRLIRVQEEILGKNRLLASRNSGYFDGRGILAVNMMSSPGSGKTTLLEHTIAGLKGKKMVAVIEGDQQTLNDARRIEATGAPVVQVNTGNACHLDAEMVMNAAKKLDPRTGSILFIENVGNLVCPSLFELGEHLRVVMVSTTEGEDKPLKYPTMFARADLCIFSKTDLLPYVEFDVEKCSVYARQINPDMEILQLSAKTGEGMAEWISWILERTGQGS